MSSPVQSMRWSAQSAFSAALPNEITAMPDSASIAFRIGVNVGDIIIDGEDIYGDGVNVAARLEKLADPGGICISGMVFDQVKGKLDAGFEDFGTHQVRISQTRTDVSSGRGQRLEPTESAHSPPRPSRRSLSCRSTTCPMTMPRSISRMASPRI